MKLIFYDNWFLFCNLSKNSISGQIVRDTIKKLGATMPKVLPTPKKSIKEIEKEVTQKLE